MIKAIIVTTRILLVDQNSLLRQGLRAMLSAHLEFQVVGEVGDGRDAVQQAVALEPDLVVTDIQLPGISGIQALAHLKRRLPKARVIMLTSSKTDDYVRESLRLGADGYVLKDASFEELLIAMRSVVLGKKYLSPDVARHLVDGYLNPEVAVAKNGQLQQLTMRERSILQLVAEGRTNRTAAEFLSVSPKTVEKHRASLMRKLGLRSATELTLTAIEMGLIERPGLMARMHEPSLAAFGDTI